MVFLLLENDNTILFDCFTGVKTWEPTECFDYNDAKGCFAKKVRSINYIIPIERKHTIFQDDVLGYFFPFQCKRRDGFALGTHHAPQLSHTQYPSRISEFLGCCSSLVSHHFTPARVQILDLNRSLASHISNGKKISM
jgi:hypothetical protein